MRRQAAVVGCLLLLGGTSVLWLHAPSRDGIIQMGFWFEPVAFDSSALGGAASAEELKTIEAVARLEVHRAFEGLRVSISDRRDAPYRVRVMQGVVDPRFRRSWEVAGASRAIAGVGGSGEVSFRLLAGYALSYAAADADRATKVTAIGTGIGRAAVHEFGHQLLPTTPIHTRADVRSYEYASAARPQQYFGEMRWSVAWPALHERFGRVERQDDPGEQDRIPLRPGARARAE